jgi:hypothetical protein
MKNITHHKARKINNPDLHSLASKSFIYVLQLDSAKAAQWYSIEAAFRKQ